MWCDTIVTDLQPYKFFSVFSVFPKEQTLPFFSLLSLRFWEIFTHYAVGENVPGPDLPTKHTHVHTHTHIKAIIRHPIHVHDTNGIFFLLDICIVREFVLGN